MNNSKLPPSVELDGPRLDEVKTERFKIAVETTKTIADLYRNDGSERIAESLELVLSAALAHGRSSETVDVKDQALGDKVRACMAAINQSATLGQRPIAECPSLFAYGHIYALVEREVAAVRAESPALGGERSPQSEAAEQPVSTDVRLVKEYDRLLVAVAHVSGLSASAVHAELQGEFDRFAAAVRQAERSSASAGLTTGTEAK